MFSLKQNALQTSIFYITKHISFSKYIYFFYFNIPPSHLLRHIFLNSYTEWLYIMSLIICVLLAFRRSPALIYFFQFRLFKHWSIKLRECIQNNPEEGDKLSQKWVRQAEWHFEEIKLSKRDCMGIDCIIKKTRMASKNISVCCYSLGTVFSSPANY